MTEKMSPLTKEAYRQVKALKGAIDGITTELKTKPHDTLLLEIKNDIVDLLWRDGNTVLLRFEASTGSDVLRKRFIASYAAAKFELEKLRMKYIAGLFPDEPANGQEASVIAQPQPSTSATKPATYASSSEPERAPSRRRTTNRIMYCQYCDETDHQDSACPEMQKRSIYSRINYVMTKGKCINCLSYTHTSKVCPFASRCTLCDSKHDTKLHIDADADGYYTFTSEIPVTHLYRRNPQS